MTVLEAFGKGLDIKPVSSCSKNSFQFGGKEKQCKKHIPDGINELSTCNSEPFQRFLDKERINGQPEIDSDFIDTHKDTPIKYANDK